jgi:uncharacterized iron-regulated membrane protein
MSLREILLRLHRWVGLSIALFLVIAGLTGSVIVFNHELDEWLNPELFTTSSDGPTLDPLELAARVEAADPTMRVTYVPLTVEQGHTLVLGTTGRINPATGLSYQPEYVEVFVDPVTGAQLAQRVWGAWGLDRKHLLPFIYKLHYSLHLPAPWGLWLMGVVALLWTIDCFVGFALTLPRRPAAPARAGGASFLSRWKPSWLVNLRANPYRINFDLHRAAGLWAWAVLFVVALSGGYLALTFEVFRPALGAVTTITPDPFDPARMQASADPGVSLASIVERARVEATTRGWEPPFDIFHSPDFRLIGVGFGDHHQPGLGVPWLYFDAGTGEITEAEVPGVGTSADVLMQWMFPLHSGQAFGLTGRILIAIGGVVTALLSVTGVVIWQKKWRGRRAIAARGPAATRTAA